MQNGDRNAFPIATFIDNLNGINNMLNGESEFYTLVTTGVTNREQLNSLITVTKNFLDQTELLINLKNLGEKVHVPDFEYFTAEQQNPTAQEEFQTHRNFTNPCRLFCKIVLRKTPKEV